MSARPNSHWGRETPPLIHAIAITRVRPMGRPFFDFRIVKNDVQTPYAKAARR